MLLEHNPSGDKHFLLESPNKMLGYTPSCFMLATVKPTSSPADWAVWSAFAWVQLYLNLAAELNMLTYLFLHAYSTFVYFFTFGKIHHWYIEQHVHVTDNAKYLLSYGNIGAVWTWLASSCRQICCNNFFESSWSSCCDVIKDSLNCISKPIRISTCVGCCF